MARVSWMSVVDLRGRHLPRVLITANLTTWRCLVRGFSIASLIFLLALTTAVAHAELEHTLGFQVLSDQTPDVAGQPDPQPVAAVPTRQVPPVASSAPGPRYGIAEAYRSDAASQLGYSWERLIFSWADIQPGGPDDWRADLYFPPQLLQQEIGRGVEIVGVLQFTPGWAAQNPADGQRSIPRNLTAPVDSPDNYFARFAGRMADQYKGRIDRWILWNEPEFKPGDVGAGQSFTWFGTDAQYLDLLKAGYAAIKKANPNATVIFGATSYWVDINMGREPFFKRLLKLGAGPYFDVAAFNIYWAPDDLLRIYTEMKQAMKASGIDKPIWITETNAMPYEDYKSPRLTDYRKGQNGQRVNIDVQADYVIEALALASAAGYQRVGWYRMTDGDSWREQEMWGLLRNDNTARPAFAAMKTALKYYTGASKVTFVPLEREDQPFGTPWPQDPSSYYPNWRIYQVVFDFADGRRVTALWNATDDNVRVRVPKRGSSAIMVDKMGNQAPATEVSGWYLVDLVAASVRGPMDPPGYHYIGGPPALLVETGVPANAPIEEPRLGDPGSVQPGVQISLDPPAQKFTPGQSVQFTLRIQGIEGYNSQVQLSVPDLPQGARVEMPATAFPGERVPITVRSDPTLEPNLYILKLNATGPNASASTDLVLEVPVG